VNRTNFLVELKRRNVYRAAVAYGVVAWFLTQLTTQVLPLFEIPNSAMRFVVIALAVGFPIAMLLAWLYEFTPEGIVRTEDLDPTEARSAQRATGRILDFIIIGVLLLVIAMLMVGRRPFYRQTGKSISQKSIAVLPFENLSANQENAFFADGVQDEILTNLARVADLRVISRTSTLQYKAGAQRNVRDVAKALGVSHVVEGSVQRSGGRVRVNAQLIDAKSDMQLWGQSYDRDLADVFAIENELAEQIVSQLKSKLSPQEKAAIEQKPTTDLVAHDLYIRAKTLIATAVFSTPEAERLIEAVRLLNEAIERDPAFALAYYELAYAHDVLYFTATDHTPARLAVADAAIQSLIRLRPDSGEAHFALAKHLYWGYLDYDRARAELSLARKSLPNDALAFQLAGFIDRRQGRWAESMKNLERAAEIDPQNPAAAGFFQQVALSYDSLRRYADAERLLDRAVALSPKDAALRAARAQVELNWRADPDPLLSTIGAIIAEDSSEAKKIAWVWVLGALCKRDFDGARRALAALPIDGCYDNTVPFPRFWCEGVVAQLRGDKAAASAAFINARDEGAKLVAEQPNYAEALCVLGMADAALGHKEDAIREGRRAVELLPVTKDAIIGALLVKYLALIYAWTGEKDLALEQLSIAAGIPSHLSYGELRLHPYWDSLRGDPRFEKLFEESKKPLAIK
jgi:TolB-like protein/Tfp pilus assembly protein PilF